MEKEEETGGMRNSAAAQASWPPNLVDFASTSHEFLQNHPLCVLQLCIACHMPHA